MSTILFWTLALIGACFVLAATVSAVQALRRGASIRATFKSWLAKVLDATSGIG